MAGASTPAPLPHLSTLFDGIGAGGNARNPHFLPHFGLLSGTLTSYNLTLDQGTYTYTGSAVLADYQVSLAQGSYTYSGQTVALKRGLVLQMASGSYGVNGQTVQLTRSRIMPLAQGSYSLTGQDVTLRYAAGTSIVLLRGDYTYTGQDVTLRVNRTMTCGSGVYTLTGQNMGFGYVQVVKETVPYLIGMLEQQARDVIAALHCIANVSSSGGTVIAQSPDHMTEVLRGTTISVTMGGAVNTTRLRRRNGLPPYSMTEAR